MDCNITLKFNNRSLFCNRFSVGEKSLFRDKLAMLQVLKRYESSLNINDSEVKYGSLWIIIVIVLYVLNIYRGVASFTQIRICVLEKLVGFS